MKLRLYTSKRYDESDYNQARYIRFAVIDLDKSKKYPENYVCMLPQKPRANGKARTQNIFSELFGKDSLELAKRLLAETLKAEDDSEIKAEIEKRLRLLEPKPAFQVKCRVCGKL